MINKTRSFFNPLLNIIVIPIQWLHPNVISLLAFAISLPGFYFLLQGRALLGSTFMIGAIFDALDGVVARKTGKTSKFGEIMDASMDRIYDGLILIVLAEGGFVSYLLAFAAYILFNLVSYFKAKAETALQVQKLGVNELTVGVAERPERMGLIFVGLLVTGIWNPVNLMSYILYILMLGSLVTIIWRAKVFFRLIKN